MQNIILSVLGAATLLGFLFFLGSKSPGAVPAGDVLAAGNVLSASENSYDFGEVSMKDGLVRHTFTIANSSSTTPLVVSRVSTSCMCTEAFLESRGQKIGPFGMPGHGGFAPRIKEEVGAGESRELEVVFDPAAHGPAGVGRIERAVFIEDEGGGTQTITIRALVTP